MSAAIAPTLVRDTLTMAQRAWTLTRRTPVSLFISSIFPVLLLVLLSAGFGGIVMPGGTHADYVNHALPLFVTMGITFGTLPTAMAVHVDRMTGFDDRLRTLPVSSAAPLVGRVLADGVRNLVTVAVVTIVGLVLGFRFSGGLPGVLGYALVPLVYGFGLAWPMVAVAMRAGSAETTNTIANTLMLALSFLSTGFVPLEDLPGWVQPIARVNPVSQVVETMRAFAHGDRPLAGPLLATVAWSVGLTLVFATVAIRSARRRP